MRPTLQERFDAKYIPEPMSGCWIWTACCSSAGYGSFWTGEDVLLAHRISWMIHNGPIPDGMHVCHQCDTRPCVNPSHLWLGTNADNVADMDKKGRNKQPTGESHGMAKLTEKQVGEIRRYPGSLRAAAAHFGVASSTIERIKNRKLWRHIA